MKLSVTDPAVLAALRPLDVAAYLRSRGWAQVEPGTDDPLPLWEKKTDDGEIEDAYCPRNQNWRDYGRRIKELLEVLSRIEERSELAILRDITEVSADVVRLVARNGARSDGSILLGDGLRLGSAGRGMMLSAACAVTAKKRAWHTRKPTLATNYLDGLLMGQSERGSYVLTVISPVAPALLVSKPVEKQATLPLGDFNPPSEDPFERKVTRVLGVALAALGSAARDGASSGEFEAFEAAVEHGVSADLCEAVALVKQCASVTELEIQIGWAPARPTEVPVTRAMFSQDALRVIAEGGRMLRERSPIDDFQVDGTVVRLGRPTDAFNGEAVVDSFIAGVGNRKISIELWGDNWQRADKALGSSRRLRCVGELQKAGKFYSLKNAREVELAEDE